MMDMAIKFIQIAAAYKKAKKLHADEKLGPEIRERLKRLALPGKALDSRYRRVLEQMAPQLAGRRRKESSTMCPECDRPFSLMTIDGLELDFCEHCSSFWFDTGELRHFTALFADVPGENLKNRQSKYLCPICHAQMQECVFLNRRNLLVDKCPNDHGVYLECGEFNRALTLSLSSNRQP
jgi:Zn-finger nucleic acid-binding protein